MKTKPIAIVLVLICTLFTATGQVFFKKGAEKLGFTVPAIISNYWLIVGLVLYAAAAVLLIFALRQGELSIVYPIIATSYVWVALLSMYFFHEEMGVFKWAGIGCIIFGVLLIGLGGKE